MPWQPPTALLPALPGAGSPPYVFCKDHQGPLLLRQLQQEAGVEGEAPDVSFVARVEEDGADPLFPELICGTQPR